MSGFTTDVEGSVKLAEAPDEKLLARDQRQLDDLGGGSLVVRKSCYVAHMAELTRFGVAMEKSLLGRFDDLVSRRGFENRSEAIRDLVRRELDEDVWQRGGLTVATITLIYDHHVRELTERLTEVQHAAGNHIISALHVHLDHHHCMEVIAAKGPARALKLLADRLIGTKGVLSGNVVAAALPTSSE